MAAAKRFKADDYKRALGIAMDALNMYANPESYHAIAFLGDAPCGDFARDFDETHKHPHYDRPMPGAKARKAVRALRRKYGGLRLIDPAPARS